MVTESAQRWGSTLDSVVVYAQGAVCRRLTGGGVPPDGRVRVTGLPRSLDPRSLRARVLGSGGVRVTEARVEVEAEPLGTDGSDELRRTVDRLTDEVAAARGRRNRQRGLIEEIGALRPVPPARKRDAPHRRTPVDAWLELGAFVEERLAALHGRLAELEKAVRDAEHELGVAADRLARASDDAPSAHVATTVCAVLTLDGTGDAEVEAELEYEVPGACWVPAYRLDCREGDDSGRLVLRASIAQRTGEDWTGVRVALATADLRRRTDLQRLRSIRIGRSQPAPASTGWREPPAGLADLFSGYDAAGPAPGPAAAPAPAGPGVPARGAVEGFASGPVPPPPAPMAQPESYAGQPYGAPAPAGAAMPAPPQPGGTPAGSSAFGGAPGAPASAGSVPPPEPSGPGHALRRQRRSGAGSPPPTPSPAAGPPQPGVAELDYASLVLSGPDEQPGRRGRLFPDSPFDPVTAEYRRRARAVAALPLPGLTVRPGESAGSFAHRFDAAARADIPSDGTWHTVTVGEIPVGLRTEYVLVPSVEQTVYTTLVLSNDTDQALLAGPVEVTADDSFLLTAALPTLSPGSVRRVGLGPAEGIRVTRRTNLYESTAGLRNNTTVLDHRVHVELANRLARAVTVEVRERVPVSSEPDVRIEERAEWTVPEEVAGPERHAPGTRVWRLDLPAGATAALDGGYEIRIPAGKALAGGNRRS